MLYHIPAGVELYRTTKGRYDALVAVVRWMKQPPVWEQVTSSKSVTYAAIDRIHDAADTTGYYMFALPPSASPYLYIAVDKTLVAEQPDRQDKMTYEANPDFVPQEWSWD